MVGDFWSVPGVRSESGKAGCGVVRLCVFGEGIGMKALSVRQPWAWLIVNGFKDIENRTWRRHRVPAECAIHASMRFDREGYEFVKERFPDLPLPEPEEFERGGIVGVVECVECVEESDSPWFLGPFGYLLADPRPCVMIPSLGQLGFFEVGGVDFDFVDQAANPALVFRGGSGCD